MIQIGYKSSYPTKTEKDKSGKKDYSLQVREISNGWVINESWTEGEGEKRQYKNKETYTDKNPIEKD